jgi:hypothetical protein
MAQAAASCTRQSQPPIPRIRDVVAVAAKL